MSQHPVRRCQSCIEDWPNMSRYNLCPRCRRNTYAGTTDEKPDYPSRYAEAERLDAIHAFDDACDLAHELNLEAMEAALALVPDIPDPDTLNPQHVDFWDWGQKGSDA